MYIIKIIKNNKKIMNRLLSISRKEGGLLQREVTELESTLDYQEKMEMIEKVKVLKTKETL